MDSRINRISLTWGISGIILGWFRTMNVRKCNKQSVA